MNKSLAHQVLESQLNCLANPYIALLGAKFHHTRVPRTYDNGDVLVIMSMEEGEKSYTPWLTWTIHGLDQIYKLRLMQVYHECHQLELVYDKPVTVEEGQKVISYFIRDMHDELVAYANRVGFPSMNIHIF